MRFEDLPFELRSSIYIPLQRWELHRLMLTCRWLNREISVILYRTCTFTRGSTSSKLVATLTNSPHLSALVYGFLIISGDTPWDQMLLALQQTVNLKRLVLQRPKTQLIKPSGFKGCTFKLETFETSLEIDDFLGEFLETQTALRAIYFRYFGFFSFDSPDAPLRAPTLPNLVILSAQPKTLRVMLPGRSLTHLEIVGSESSGVLVLDSIWNESFIANPTPRALRMLPFPLSIDYWRDIPTFFPKLRYLNMNASLPVCLWIFRYHLAFLSASVPHRRQCKSRFSRH